jgi:O-acetyl-ADP-ribose deacetylase (regulator of RNase III)
MAPSDAVWNGCRIELWQGDITTLAVDAIVNAANPWLAGGGGVDGAIHRRGGPNIAEQCQAIMRQRQQRPLEPGEAVLTTGGDLPARYVIHTVGPVYREWPAEQAAKHLAACYRNCLVLLRQQGLRSIAFPSISTGAYGYPPEQACSIALRSVRQELLVHNACDRVIFCTFSQRDFELYQRELAQLLAESSSPTV